MSSRSLFSFSSPSLLALLIDMDFGHQPAEVLGVVRQVIEIGGVEIEHATRRIHASYRWHPESRRVTRRQPSVIELV